MFSCLHYTKATRIGQRSKRNTTNRRKKPWCEKASSGFHGTGRAPFCDMLWPQCRIQGWWAPPTWKFVFGGRGLRYRISGAPGSCLKAFWSTDQAKPNWLSSLADPGGPGGPAPPLAQEPPFAPKRIMQFSGNFKEKTPILTRFGLSPNGVKTPLPPDHNPGSATAL